jgi:pyridoxal phosphate enzyme (YggS family)
MSDADRIRENIRRVRERMVTACERSGRDPESVRLLMATKTVDPDRIRVAIESGETLVAENRVQEVRPKFEALEDLEYERHFIGHLQSNKVNAIVPYISCLETLDRLSLARKLANRLEREGQTLEVLIQVNTSGEETKAGLDPDEVEPFIRTVAGLEVLKIRGLMTIGLNAEPEVARPSLASLRQIADRVREQNIDGVEMNELSMGMTGDLEVAIEEGSTIVRVGSAIFGSR